MTKDFTFIHSLPQNNAFKMNFFKHFTSKEKLSSFILGLCLFLTSSLLAQTDNNWIGGTDNSWNTPANWSLGTVPGPTDNVLIPKTGTVVVPSTPASACARITVQGDDASQGSLTINAGATLSANGDLTSAVLIQGGTIQNNGTLSLTGASVKEGIRFGSPVNGGINNSTYQGSGNLTINITNTTGTGACVYFTQTSGTAVFNLGSGNFNLTPADGANVFQAVGGDAQIRGTGTITTSGAFRTVRAQSSGSVNTHLTIGSGVTLNTTISLLTTFTGAFYLDRSGSATPAVTLTNNGTINISGTANNGIYFNTASSDVTNSATFNNTGTIKINGSFTDATANVTLGGICFGGVNAAGSVFTNSGTIEYNTTVAGTSSKPLFYSGTNPTYTITNTSTGVITVGANAPTFVTAFRLGNSLSKIENEGTITIEKGNITAGGATAILNNKSTGTMNFNIPFVASPFPVIMNTNINFTNDGKIKGTGAINNTTTVTYNASSVFEPSQPGSVIGRLIYYKTAAFSWAGATLNADVHGATSAGVDFDQISGTNAAAVIDVTGMKINVTFGGGYTPANGDVIRLVTAGGSIVGTPIFGTLPTGWAGSVAADAKSVNITYTMIVPVELVSFSAKAQQNMNKLTWVTASEVNNKGFDIQRQTQTGAWASLGFVNAQGKAANYTFEDNAPLSISYYRLRQVDFDGKESLSKVVAVNLDKKVNTKVYPTLATDNIHIALNGNEGATDVQIVNLLGQVVKAQKLQNTEGVTTLQISDLATGSYLLQLVSKSGNVSYRFEKQ